MKKKTLQKNGVLVIALLITGIQFSVAQSTTSSNALSGTQTAPNEYLGSSNLFDVLFRTNGFGTDRMRISSSNGYVSIGGIVSPLRQLHIQTSQTNGGLRISQTTSGFSALELYNSTTAAHNWALVSTGNGNGEGAGAFGIYDYSAPGYRMFINTNGFIGIGSGFTTTAVSSVTAPTSLLHLKGDLTLGNSVNSNRWGFNSYSLTPNPNSDFLLSPDNGAGVYNWEKGLRIERTSANFVFSALPDNGSDFSKKATIGTANGATLGYGNTYFGFNMNRTPSSSSWTLRTDGANNGGSVIWSNMQGHISFSCFNGTTTNGNASQTATDTQVKDHRTLMLAWVPWMNGGNGAPQVTIGKGLTGGPQIDYTLGVSGKIVAKEIYVTLTNWADYVFDDTYKLKSLNELETYIKNNKHLPNVPTTCEIIENGNNTGETDRILLEKIEELTLYIIEQNKKIEALEKKMENVSNK
jgi:hypothetical protein